MTANDALSQLGPLSWRGIIAPYDSLKTSGGQTIVQHRKPDRDGARLEATGRNPYKVSATILFHNGIAWDKTVDPSRPLFPDQYLAFFAACADRTTGDLLHPVLGKMRAKVEAWDSTIVGARRDGAAVYRQVNELAGDDG